MEEREGGAMIPFDSNGGDDGSINLGSIESESVVSTEPGTKERKARNPPCVYEDG